VPKKKRGYSAEFKAAAVERMKDCDNVVALGGELKVHWRQLYKWKAAGETAATEAQNGPERRESALREEIARLKIALAAKRWKWIFSEVPCGTSKLYAKSARPKAERHLRPNPGSNATAGQSECGTDVSSG
jgi:Transposase